MLTQIILLIKTSSTRRNLFLISFLFKLLKLIPELLNELPVTFNCSILNLSSKLHFSSKAVMISRHSYYPIVGVLSATGTMLFAARSSGKLWAFLSCMTSKPRFARLRTSAHVFTTWPLLVRIDWLKLRPFRLNAIVETPRAVNQMPTTGQAARKKWRLRLLLKDAYWKISLPK